MRRSDCAEHNLYPARSVAVCRGHDVEFWTRFLQALERVDSDIAVNIEHEDVEPRRLEGLQVANSVTAASRG